MFSFHGVLSEKLPFLLYFNSMEHAKVLHNNTWRWYKFVSYTFIRCKVRIFTICNALQCHLI